MQRTILSPVSRGLVRQLRVSSEVFSVRQDKMPSIKIYPPTQLPDRNVSETQFNIWTEELEVYLSQEKDFAIFLPGGSYEGWGSFETNNARIVALVPADRVVAGGNITAEQAAEQNRDRLVKRQRDLVHLQAGKKSSRRSNSR